MTLQIDTGNIFDPVTDGCPAWLRDMLPDTATRETVAQAMAEHLMGDMAHVKRADTVRKRLLAQWAFLRALADIDPDQFDAILMEFAERMTCVR